MEKGMEKLVDGSCINHLPFFFLIYMLIIIRILLVR